MLLLYGVIANEQRLTRQRDRVLIKRNSYAQHVCSISELAKRCLRDPKNVSPGDRRVFG